MADASSSRNSELSRKRDVVTEVTSEAYFRLLDFVLPVQIFNSLVQGQRDQYADDDDADLGYELANPMHWLGLMDIHVIPDD
jgi:hypothetical protein